MPVVTLKVARIGNSRGVRLPAASLRRYRIADTVVMEERSEGILLRPAGTAVEKLSWNETAQAMAASDEDWSVWEAVDADGIDAVPWRPQSRRRRAGAPAQKHATSSRRKPR